MRPALACDSGEAADVLLVADMLAAATTGQLLRILVGDDAAQALEATGSIRTLIESPPGAVGLTSLARLGAVRELVARLVAEPRPTRQRVTGPEDAARLCADLAVLDHEEFLVIHLDVKHKVLAVERAAVGTAWQVEVSPMAIFRPAMARGSAALIIVHNHPSGDPLPSEADRDITRRLTDGAALLGLRIIDHIVIGGAQRFYSFAQERVLTAAAG